MKDASVRGRLNAIEEQIKVLKAELDAGPKQGRGATPRRFADLYGIWKGKVNLSFEEMQDAEIKLREER
jgi:hypothetical protein